MQTEIYPYGSVEDSLEHHLGEHSKRSQAIYLVIVLSLLGALAMLPVVRVGVSVQSDGIIRPVTEKHDIQARAAGFAEALEVEENQRVEKGQVLLRLRATPLEDRIGLVAAQLDQTARFVADLELLTRVDRPLSLPLERFATAKYRQEYVQLTNALREIAIREEKAVRELERTRALAERNLVPLREAEDRAFELSQIRSERSLLIERRQSAWQSQLATTRMEWEEQASRRAQLEEERALYTVRSPVTGTVEQLASISPGSYVQAGEQLAVISPISSLVAEVYVTPRDIGLLREGIPARIQVDAFNYNDWGFITGHVSEISSDFSLVNQVPVFLVKVALDQSHLSLKNGFRGELRKGMTLRARFMVAERTLFQLLRDDVNDWLNPVQAG